MYRSTEQGVHVVLVENHPADEEHLAATLRECGADHLLTVFYDGDEASHCLSGRKRWRAARRPDVILLDLNLHKKNGLVLLTELRSNMSTRSIPVLILTSSQENVEILRTYQLDIDGFVIRPITVSGLQTLLERLPDLRSVNGTPQAMPCLIR